MDVNKMAGWCLIILAVVNVLHGVFTHYRDGAIPGVAFALVTALLVTFGVVLLVRKPIAHGRK